MFVKLFTYYSTPDTLSFNIDIAQYISCTSVFEEEEEEDNINYI